MKKSVLILFFAAFICIVALSSCNKIIKALFPAFDTEIGDVTLTIPATAAGMEVSTSNTITFNLDSTIKAYTQNAFSTEDLTSVKVKNAGIILINDDDLNDISNFDSISIKIASNSNNTPAVIASVSVPDTRRTSFIIPVANSPELKGYLNGSQLTYTITSRTRRLTTKPLQMSLGVTLALK